MYQAEGGGGYPQGGGGYPQGGGGYPQGGGGYPQGGGGGYPQGGGGGYPQGGAPGYQQGGYPQPPASGYPQAQPQPTAGYPGGPPAAPGGPVGGDGPTEPAYKGEVPDEDVEVDPNSAPGSDPSPTAPPASAFEVIPGYNQMDAALPPPSYENAMGSQPPQRAELPPAPSVNDEQAREALLEFVSQHCCYGKGAANNMDIKDIVQSSAFHYKLETFTEKRVTKYASEPYRGQLIDSAANGPAPGPWDIAINVPGLFQQSKAEVEVPHTASIKPCHDCHGAGFRRCGVCLGRGRTRCHFCHGSGRVQDFGHHHMDHHHHHGGRHGSPHHHHHHHHHHGMNYRPCTSCMGLGRNRCFSCGGLGQKRCTTCEGTSNLKTYIKLVVTWTTHADDSIVERTGLPDELIRGVSGQSAFEEQSQLVWPVGHFQDQAINTASRQLVEKHRNSFQLERILMQRHKITIVPVGEVHCSWNDKTFSYFVYGFENKVHAPDYPTKCCCTIL